MSVAVIAVRKIWMRLALFNISSMDRGNVVYEDLNQLRNDSTKRSRLMT